MDTATEDVCQEGPHQLEVLIAVAISLGGILMLEKYEGSIWKLLGGTVLSIVGAFVLIALFREWRRKRKGMPAGNRARIIEWVIYPVCAVLAIVAVLAPFAIIAKLILISISSHP